MKQLKQWQIETDKLADHFIERYFGKNIERYWIADEIGGVLSVADYFFGVSDIVEFLRYHYSKDKMFEYYDYNLSCLEKGIENKYNIKSYRHFQ